jgi:hypothetical protein
LRNGLIFKDMIFRSPKSVKTHGINGIPCPFYSWENYKNMMGIASVPSIPHHISLPSCTTDLRGTAKDVGAMILGGTIPWERSTGLGGPEKIGGLC